MTPPVLNVLKVNSKYCYLGAGGIYADGQTEGSVDIVTCLTDGLPTNRGSVPGKEIHSYLLHNV